MAECLDASSTTKVIQIKTSSGTGTGTGTGLYPPLNSLSGMPTIPIGSQSYNPMHFPMTPMTPMTSVSYNGILYHLTEKLNKRCEEFMKQFVKQTIEDIREILHQGKTPEEIADILGGINHKTTGSGCVNFKYNDKESFLEPYQFLSASDYLNPSIQKEVKVEEADGREEADADADAEAEDDGVEEAKKIPTEEMEVITDEYKGEKVYIPLEEPFFIYKREVDEDDNLSYFGDLVGVLDSDDIVWEYQKNETHEEHSEYFCSGNLIGTPDDILEKTHKNPDLQEIILSKRGATIPMESSTKEPIWGKYQKA
jgi:hypothetical protein